MSSRRWRKRLWVPWKQSLGWAPSPASPSQCSSPGPGCWPLEPSPAIAIHLNGWVRGEGPSPDSLLASEGAWRRAGIPPSAPSLWHVPTYHPMDLGCTRSGPAQQVFSPPLGYGKSFVFSVFSLATLWPRRMGVGSSWHPRLWGEHLEVH